MEIFLIIVAIIIGFGIWCAVNKDKLDAWEKDAKEKKKAAQEKRETLNQLSDSMFGDVIPGTSTKPVVQKPERSNPIVEICSSDSGESYSVHIEKLTCTCPDFQKSRAGYYSNDPRKLCKHLVKVLVRQQKIPSQLIPYQEEIRRCESKDIGFLFKSCKHETKVGNDKLVIFDPEESEIDIEMWDYWVQVYFRNQRHAYNPMKDCWTYTARNLPELEEITQWIREQIEIDKWLSGLKQPSTRQPMTTEEELSAFRLIEDILKDSMPQGVEFTYKDTLSYFVVSVEGSRKWLCRLYFNSANKYIEFPNGEKLLLKDVADLVGYKEKLQMSAVL